MVNEVCNNRKRKGWKSISWPKKKIHEWDNKFSIKMLMLGCYKQHKHVGQHWLPMIPWEAQILSLMIVDYYSPMKTEKERNDCTVEMKENNIGFRFEIRRQLETRTYFSFLGITNLSVEKKRRQQLFFQKTNESMQFRANESINRCTFLSLSWV